MKYMDLVKAYDRVDRNAMLDGNKSFVLKVKSV